MSEQISSAKNALEQSRMVLETSEAGSARARRCARRSLAAIEASRELLESIAADKRAERKDGATCSACGEPNAQVFADAAADETHGSAWCVRCGAIFAYLLR